MFSKNNGRYAKHKRLLALVQIWILCFALPISAQGPVKELVQIVVDDFPPYIVKQDKSGLITEVLKQAFALEGVEVEIEMLPWSEVEGQVDTKNKLSFMWSKTAERHQKWSYSNPIYVNRQVLVAKKADKVFWRRLDELRQYKLGVTKHYNYGVNFEDYRQFLNLTESVSDYSSLKRLVRNKVDAVVVEELQAHNLLSYFTKPIQGQLEVLGHEAIDTSETHVVCSRNYAKCAHFIRLFNDGLGKLKASGRYQEIISKGL